MRRTALAWGLALLVMPLLAGAEDAGPSQGGLLGVRWRWVHFTTPGSAPLIPPQPDKYWVEFLPEGQLALQADCNQGFGKWTRSGNNIVLTPLGTTLAACPPGSLDSRFTQLLAAVRTASVRGHMLLLRLPDGGVVHLEAMAAAAKPPP